MAIKDSVSTGQFDRRISIQSYTRVDDGQGGSSDGTWSTIYACFADMQNPLHGRGLYRKFMFAQLYPQASMIIQIRFQKTIPIDATMRVQYVAHGVTHLYQILGVENPNEANVSLYLLCTEYQAKTPN